MGNQSKRVYFLQDYETPYTAKELKVADREIQLEAMEVWFFENFEDPANQTPYEGKEGGYIYIWGGPYDAREELEDQFSDIIPSDLIAELADKLSGICWDWAPIPKPDDYAINLAEEISEISDYYHNFTGYILDIKHLLKTPVDGTIDIYFYRLLYANVITALETYLSDAFIHTIFSEPEIKKRFVEALPKFREEKIRLSEIFKTYENIDNKIKEFLGNFTWHNLKRAKELYLILKIDFPENIAGLLTAIQNRHDIIHRNGKTKNGKEFILGRVGVENLIKDAENFVQHIDKQLKK